MMKVKLVFLFVLIQGIVTSLVAQTNHFQLIWDNNTENDMYLYRVFKGTSSNNLQLVDSVYFPDSTYNDYKISKGTLYYYAVKAVDFSLNASDFSQVVSAAIPQIKQLPDQIECPPDTTMQFALDNHVSDPDHSAQQIQWKTSGYSQLQVNLNNSTHLLTVTTPSNWSGQDRLDLTATDPDGFFDKFSIFFVAKAVENSAPQLNTIPQQTTPEDQPFTLNLLQFVNDEDSSPAQLTFEVTPGNHLTTELKDTLLTVIPEKNWFGTSQIRITVTDESGLSDNTQFDVVVTSVNDPPVLSKLPNFKLTQDTSVVVALNDYVYDVDHDKASLTWEFANHPHLTLNYEQSTQQLTISTPVGWSGFEYIQARVIDPENAWAQDTITVQVFNESQAPVLSTLPEIVINEDEQTTVDLNKYVDDPDTPNQNLFWEASGVENLVVEIDYQTKIMRVKGQPDWFGSEQFWLKVTDPEQQSDSVQVTVTVLPVNDAPYFQNFPVVDLSEQNPRSIAYQNYINDIDNSVDELFVRFIEHDSVQMSLQGEQLQFQVAEDWYGSQQVTLIVQDPAGAADSTLVLVYRQNLARAPRIIGLDTLHIWEDQHRKISLRNKVSDPDNSSDQITWEVLTGVNVKVQLDSENDEALLQPEANWWGEEQLVFKATDPDGYFDFDTLKVYVQPVNDPPELKSIPDLTMLAGTYHTIDLKEYLYDADGYDDLVKIELLNNPNSYIGYFLTDNNFRATFFAPQGYHGNETFMLRVTDRFNEQAVAIFVVKVLARTVKSGITVSTFGSGTVMNFSWISRMPTRDLIEYSLDYSFDQKTQQEEQFTTEHQFTLENLEPDQTYHFRIVSLDENGNVVVNPDSTFTTGKAVNEVNVFPIPYRKNDPQSGDGIYFTNLGQQTTLTILNLLGEMVLQKMLTNQPVFRWDLKNSSGREVHSGVYFYHVKTDGKTYRGKLIIIR